MARFSFRMQLCNGQFGEIHCYGTRYPDTKLLILKEIFWIFFGNQWLPIWISIIYSKKLISLYTCVITYRYMRSNEFFCSKYWINLQENSRHSIGLTLRRPDHFVRWPNFVCSFWKFLFFQNIIMILSFFSCLIRLMTLKDFFKIKLHLVNWSKNYLENIFRMIF